MARLMARRPAALRGWADNLRVPWSAKDALWLMIIYWVGLQLLLAVPLVVAARLWAPAAAYMQAIDANDPMANFAFVAVETAATALLLAGFLRRRRARWSDLGWRRFRPWQAAGLVLAALIVFYLASSGVDWLVQHLLHLYNVNQPQTNEFTGSKAIGTRWALLALVVIPPLVEETLYRGVLFAGLTGRWGFWAAAVASSALFGLAHAQANVGVYTFILGMLLCWLYARTRSIVPGVVLHLLNNLLAWLAMVSR